MVRIDYRVEVTLSMKEAQELRLILDRSPDLCSKLLNLYHDLKDALPELVS